MRPAELDIDSASEAGADVDAEPEAAADADVAVNDAWTGLSWGRIGISLVLGGCLGNQLWHLLSVRPILLPHKIAGLKMAQSQRNCEQAVAPLAGAAWEAACCWALVSVAAAAQRLLQPRLSPAFSQARQLR